MIYSTSKDWENTPNKRVMLFGMSGVGKTTLSNLLRADKTWFHYSADYRIATRYMGEFIGDNVKREAMKVPLLRELLLTDSVYIQPNITVDNLAPLSSYLGKPGRADLGGLCFSEYQIRQNQHQQAEIAALRESAQFITQAHDIYGYDNFICDSGGSICEVCDPFDTNDTLLNELAKSQLLVWIKGSEAYNKELIKRFDHAAKPMCYQSKFLNQMWRDYQTLHGQGRSQVDPDAFVRFTFSKALAHREPRYLAMAKWGVTVTAEDVALIKNSNDFNALIARAIEQK
ncbi:MAG: ATPase [Paracoccaceae bacterium]|jgi:hypothetical protein